MSNIKTETQACEASATNIEQLKQNAEGKISPDIINDLIALIKEKFGEDISNPFDITCQELDALKSQLEGEKANKQEILRKFVYKEFLEKKGISGASLDTLFVDIKDPTALDMKKSFDEGIDKYLLSQYTFLSPESKSVIKLGLANKVLKEFLYGKFKGNFEAFNSFMAKLSSGSIKGISEVKEAVEGQKDSAKEVEEFIKGLIGQYKTAFDKIQQDEKINGLNDEQKQNVISHISWFRDPTLVEQGADTIDFNQINPLNKDSKNNNIDDINKISEYMAKSKGNLDTLMGALQQGEAVSNVIYKMIDVPVVGDVIKEFIEFLLGLPFIGPWLAALLGLNGKDAIKDFNESISLHKFFNSFKQLGVQFNEKGEKQKGTGVEPFKDKDLSDISFRALKGEMKSIRGMFPNLKEEEYGKFWQTVFTTGVEKDGITFKLDLTDEQKSKDKLETKDFKSILSEGLNKYNTEKANKEREAEEERLRQEEEKRKREAEELRLRQEEAKKEVLKLAGEVTTIEMKLDLINRIISKDYEKLSDWDSTWNYGDIVDVSLEKIVSYASGDFGKIISDEIGITDYNPIKQEDKQMLNQLFSLVKEYIKENGIDVNGKTLKDFFTSNKSGFEEFVNKNKKGLEDEKKSKVDEKQKQERLSGESEKDLSTINFQQLVTEKIRSITETTSLLDGIDLGGGKLLRFDKEKQELVIGDNIYKIELFSNKTQYKISDIKISGNDVEVVPELSSIQKLGYSKEKGTVSKAQIINGIIELLKTQKYEYGNMEDTFLKISKV